MEGLGTHEDDRACGVLMNVPKKKKKNDRDHAHIRVFCTALSCRDYGKCCAWGLAN